MCIESPQITPPSLGGGLSIAPPALPDFSGDVNLCCKSVPFSMPDIPLGLPTGAAMAVLGPAIAAAAATINAYIASLTPKCPLE